MLATLLCRKQKAYCRLCYESQKVYNADAKPKWDEKTPAVWDTIG